MKKMKFSQFLLIIIMSLITTIGLTLSSDGRKVAPSPPVLEEEIIIMPGRIIAPPEVSPPITMKAYDVDVSVKDNLATTTIEQLFVNNSGRTLEAKYLYPLPEDANFSTFSLSINGKMVEGKIMDKDAARNSYYEIVRRYIDPGLLEFIDSKTVQVSVAPIFAGEEKRIKLSYSQLLKQDGGLYKYRYPFGFKAEGSRIPVDKASLDLNLTGSQQLKTIYSPTHSPKVDRIGTKEAKVSLELKDGKTLQEKDFVLYFSQDNNAISLNSLAFKEPTEGNGYFLVTIRSPKELMTRKTLPKSLVLVLDTSGSMSGDKIVQAKEALKYILNHLRPEDSFNVVQFNTDISLFRSELMAANQINRKAAVDYISDLKADGSTNIEGALKTAFGHLPKNQQQERPQYVIFLTDGEPTVGITDTDGLLKIAKESNRTNAKLFNFGVGYDVNTALLGKLADSHSGSTTYVEPGESLELALTSFYNKIEYPLLTDVKLDFGNLKVSRVYPEKIGDLFAGSEIVLLGRYENGGTETLKLTGKIGNETRTFTYPIVWEGNRVSEHGYLPRLWAARRISYLLDNIHQNGENRETKDEVISLSKQFGLVTPYTSFLAMSPDEKDGSDIRPMELSAPSSIMSKLDDYESNTGKGAVQLQKSIGRMKQQASASEINEVQRLEIAGVPNAVLGIKTLGEKTFILSKDGAWVDTAYDKAKHGDPIKITFGSSDYFGLLTRKPELAKYFSLGKKVIVLFENRAYAVINEPIF